MNVVVVESPAKAKTINKYLGPDYAVFASYGHVRDLPAKDGSVRPDEDFAMSWTIDERAEKRVKDIVQALKGAKALYLATDPDREGEAISWHIREVLKERKALKEIPVKRVVFNEVTKSAVIEAFANARELDAPMIDSYMARRALDYLVGFTLSPVLWRKLPGSRSAGRVQSVALRLICDREEEIEAFRSREYWTVSAGFRKGAGDAFTARLTHLDGNRLDKFDLANETDANRAVAAAAAEPGFAVSRAEHKQSRRNPQPPFTTSTLQQEASRKLGFSATRTMQLAQRLYEGVDFNGETVGLITYMRTDGVQLSQEAIGGARRLIGEEYGAEYLPAAPRQYRTVAKNAQEAHEAVRPTDFYRHPKEVAARVDPDMARLYELVWKRAVASQMESALLDQTTVDIQGASGRTAFRATGTVVRFDGFLRLYQEGQDDAGDDEADRRLPPLSNGDGVACQGAKPDQHFTEPPPRYSEASLVKKLEELGIGRPSTYASIIQVLQDRDYVRIDKKRFVPEDRGRLVTAFLHSFFERYVQYNFTADLENLLDEISGGRADWKTVLRDFWQHFSAAAAGAKELPIAQVREALDTELGRFLFPSDDSGRDPRVCPGCGTGRLSLKLGKFGAFIGCSNYPECRVTRQLGGEAANANERGEALDGGPREVGLDPATGLPVTLRVGPYGPYLQIDAQGEGAKPKRVSLPKGLKPADITLDVALGLLSLPREIGQHPETGEAISAGIGRFGPYIKCGKVFKSLSNDDDVLNVGINRAVMLLAEKGKGERGAPTPLRTLGAHPVDGAPVALFKGRYGPYVSHGGIFGSLPRDGNPETVTLEEGLALLAAQIAKGKKPKLARGAKPPAKTAAKKKPAAKAASAAKPTSAAAPKKTAAKPKKAAATAKRKTG